MIPWRKLWTNATLDWQLLSARMPNGGSGLRRLARKYSAIVRDAREMRIGGATLHYDNRFTPALIASYLHDVERLSRFVPLSSIASMVDIGANVGQLAFAVKSYAPDARIWSFEPNPEILPLLRANAAQFPEWDVVPEGVGPEATLPLHFVRGKSAQGSLHRDNALLNLDASAAVTVDVRIAPLDEARARSLGIPPQVDLLKIDVEGAELPALASVTGIKPRFVLMELSVGRAGQEPATAFEDVMRRSWGASPTTVWRSEANETHGTQEWLWRIA